MTKKLRAKKRSSIKSYLVLVLVGLFVVAVSYVALAANSPRQTGTVDYFRGTILNQDFQGKLSGVVRADTNCTPTGVSNLTCTAIIDTEVGTLQFKYTHNMAQEPCLTTNDKVTLEYRGSGITQVTRSRG